MIPLWLLFFFHLIYIFRFHRVFSSTKGVMLIEILIYRYDVTPNCLQTLIFCHIDIQTMFFYIQQNWKKYVLADPRFSQLLFHAIIYLISRELMRARANSSNTKTSKWCLWFPIKINPDHMETFCSLRWQGHAGQGIMIFSTFLIWVHIDFT